MGGVLLAVLALLVPSAAAAAGEGPLLWRATHPERGALHVLGSIHARRYGVPAVDPAADAAFERAAGIAVDLDLDPGERARVNDALVARAYLANGDTLVDRVPISTYREVRGALVTLGRPADALDAFEPWFAGMVLAARVRVVHGYREEFGLAHHYVESARGRKRIESLDSPEAAIGRRMGLAPELQALMLERTVAHLDPTRLARVERAWDAGDAQTLEALFFEDLRNEPRTAPYFERMVFERNREMAEALDALASDGEAWFAVLPVGHLLGRHSMIERLTERGWSIERVAPGAVAAPVAAD